MIVVRQLGKPWDLLPSRPFALRHTVSINSFLFSLASHVCLLHVFSCIAFCQSSSTGSNPAPTADSASPVLAEANSLLQQGKVNDAERAVHKFLAAQPESAEGHFLLGHILFREIQADANAGAQLEGVKVFQANPSDGRFIP